MPNINAQLSPLCSACELHFQLLPLSPACFSSLLATTTSSFLFSNLLTIHCIFSFLSFWYIRSLVFTWLLPMLAVSLPQVAAFFFFKFWTVVKLCLSCEKQTLFHNFYLLTTLYLLSGVPWNVVCLRTPSWEVNSVNHIFWASYLC